MITRFVDQTCARISLRMHNLASRRFLLFLMLNCSFACAQSASANTQPASTFDWTRFHQQNDRDWASRTGLSAGAVRQLRLGAGISDDEPSNPIDEIDATTLGHEQVLFVSAAGSGHCLTVEVYVPHRKSFKNIWSTSEMPDGAGLCHPSLCRNPGVWAEKGQINVTVPAYADEQDTMCNKNVLLTYRWKHKSYELTKQETLPAQSAARAN
jgi:hypothetical protein